MRSSGVAHRSKWLGDPASDAGPSVRSAVAVSLAELAVLTLRATAVLVLLSPLMLLTLLASG